MVEDNSVEAISTSGNRLATNDMYLAALLLSKDYSLVKVIHNARRRVSFIFAGEGLRELRESYRRGRVCSFGESLTRVRQMMNEHRPACAKATAGKERSEAHGSTKLTTSEPLQPGGDREPQERNRPYSLSAQ